MGSSELDELELRHRIEAGIEAADELKKRLGQLQREEESRGRPKLRLIKGGAVGVVLVAGVEWLRGYRRVAVGVLASTAAASGLVYIAPSTPGRPDPPGTAIAPPARHVAEPIRPPTPRGSVAPRVTPRSAPPTTAQKTSPPRTSPPRTTTTPSPIVTVTPTKPPATEIVESILETPTPSIVSTPTLPIVAATEQPGCSLLSLNPVGVCLKILGN